MKCNLLIYSGGIPNPNFYYYAGLPLTHAILLVRGTRKTIITTSLNQGLGKKFAGRFIITQNIFDRAGKLAGRAFCVDGSIPLRAYKKISRGARVRDATELLYEKRMKKRPDEVAKIRKAAKLAKALIAKFSNCEGKSEEEVARELLAETYREGFEPAFQPIVATGKNASTPHALCTRKKIEDFVLIDYGIKYRNYCADITRCYFFGSARAARLKEKYEKLRMVAFEVIDAAGGMEKSGGVRAFYEGINRKSGFPAPLHSVGHGIGLEVHEYPRFGRKYNDPLEGTTFTIEPGIYEKDYGLRYEETVYHNGKKAIVL